MQCSEDFNSIKVRLELCTLADTEVSFYLFQFHKGTIRTETEYNRQRELMHFNSIKVRLELQERYQKSTVNGFQFHKGTIRTFHLLQAVCGRW